MGTHRYSREKGRPRMRVGKNDTQVAFLGMLLLVGAGFGDVKVRGDVGERTLLAQASSGSPPSSSSSPSASSTSSGVQRPPTTSGPVPPPPPPAPQTRR